MSRRFIPRLRSGLPRHSIASGYVYETIRSFATGGVATLSPWELSARAARDIVVGINHPKALERNHRYWAGGLAGNSYRYRVRDLDRGMATTAAKDDGEGFSVKSSVKVSCAKPKHVSEEDGADKSDGASLRMELQCQRSTLEFMRWSLERGPRLRFGMLWRRDIEREYSGSSSPLLPTSE